MTTVPETQGMFATFTVRRASGAQTVVNHKIVTPAPTSIQIEMSVQQARPEELVNLPEGDRTREAKKLYSNPAMKTSSQQTLQQSDIVEIDGFDFRVAEVSNWKMGTLDHFKAIAVKQDA